MPKMTDDPGKTFGETLLKHVFFHGGKIESPSQTAHVLEFHRIPDANGVELVPGQRSSGRTADAGKGVQQ